MFKSRVARLLATAVLFAVRALAQSTKAELLGTVRDPSGVPADNARVELTNAATGVTAATRTGAQGEYVFFALSAGQYRLAVSKDGFTPLRREGVVLRTGDRIVIDLSLELAAASASLEVTAAAPLLQTSRGTVSFVVEQQKVATLPIDGRNFVPLIALAPGVTLPPGSVLPRINGSRPRVSEYIYDGVSVLQPEPGQVAFYPIIDAIEEFRVETNSYSAEYGRSNGGVIMVNQKSGANQLHGTVFEFFRNERLNARNLFATNGPKPLFRRNQYGFTLGGPVQKNRTFFFADWQGTRLGAGVVRTSTVPSAAQRSGVFLAPVYDPATTRRSDGAWLRDAFPGNTIPAARFDRAAQAVVERYPAPNVAGATANNYRRTGNDTTAAEQFDGRVDRYFGTRHRIFGRYSFLRDDSRPTTPLPDGSGNLTTGVIANTLTRADSLVAEHTLTVSPAAVNQLRFGYTRRRFERNASSLVSALPVYDITGLQQLGPPSNSNARLGTSVTQIVDNYSWTPRRSHSIKAGADLRWETLDVLQPASPNGNFQFTPIFTGRLAASGAVTPGTGDSFASFLTGQVTRYSIDVQPDTIQPRAAIAEFFLQDDWRVTDRLTLNPGVRYTLNFPSTVIGNRGAVFNLGTQRLDLLGVNGTPRSARNLEKANFAPRMGLAYRLAPSFVVRAGYGMTWIEQAGITTPFTTPLFPFIQTLGQQTLDNIASAFVLSQGPSVRAQSPGPDSGLGQGVFGVQRDNGSGYAQQWNLTLQKTVGAHWSIEAGYLGSKLTRLGVPDVNLNQLTVDQLALGSQLTDQVPNPYPGIPSIARGQLLRPYPRFTTVALYRNNTGHSTYHALQARVEKRFSRGLTFTAAYTLSRLIDDAGAVFDSALLAGPVANFQAADSFNKRLEKDVSTGNVPHVFSSGFVYQLPFGLQVAALVRAQSGSPVAVMQAANLNAFAGFGIQRPNRLADPALPASSRSPARWFDTAAFSPAPQFTIGSSSRNPVTGPGYRTVDLMLGKTFALGERARAEFRAEAFNALNTPPLGSPNGSFGSAAFGSIATALDPRVFELVLKLHF
ncbi:MAG: TonB-dependent receptor [Bryobacteraceae bacterium]